MQSWTLITPNRKHHLHGHLYWSTGPFDPAFPLEEIQEKQVSSRENSNIRMFGLNKFLKVPIWLSAFNVFNSSTYLDPRTYLANVSGRYDRVVSYLWPASKNL